MNDFNLDNFVIPTPSYRPAPPMAVLATFAEKKEAVSGSPPDAMSGFEIPKSPEPKPETEAPLDALEVLQMARGVQEHIQAAEPPEDASSQVVGEIREAQAGAITQLSGLRAQVQTLGGPPKIKEPEPIEENLEKVAPPEQEREWGEFNQKVLNEQKAVYQARVEKPESKIESTDKVGIKNYLAEGLGRILERTGTRPWLETVAPRMEAFAHRHSAQVDSWFEIRAQSELVLATKKAKEYARLLEDPSLTSFWHAQRLRKWQTRQSAAEVRVASLGAQREATAARHSQLQRQVEERYNLEAAKYESLINKLSANLDAEKKIKGDLQQRHDKAVEVLKKAQEDADRGRFFRGAKGKKAVADAEASLKALRGLIGEVDGNLGNFGKTLLQAQERRGKYQAKAVETSQAMATPEFLPAPIRASEAPASEVVVTLEQDPLTKTWEPIKFADFWNQYHLKPAIERPREFFQYVSNEQAKQNQLGAPSTQRLLDLAAAYLKIDDKTKKRNTVLFKSLNL